MKIKVNQPKIKQLIKGGMKDYAISRRTAISHGIIKRIRSGEDVPYYFSKPRRGDRLIKKGMCECCGINKIMEGNRMLCEYCFKNEGRSEIYPECSIGLNI